MFLKVLWQCYEIGSALMYPNTAHTSVFLPNTSLALLSVKHFVTAFCKRYTNKVYYNVTSIYSWALRKMCCSVFWAIWAAALKLPVDIDQSRGGLSLRWDLQLLEREAVRWRSLSSAASDSSGKPWGKLPPRAHQPSPSLEFQLSRLVWCIGSHQCALQKKLYGCSVP